MKIPGGDFLTINPSNNTNAFGGQVTGDSSNGFTVTNQLPKTEIEVTKQWKDGTSANADRVFEEAGTIDFTVWQKQGEKEPAVYTAYGQNGSGTVSYDPSTGEWQTVNISDLPEYVYDSDSESWLAASYYVVETDPGEVEITYQKEGGNSSGAPADAAVGPDDTAGTITITNEDLLGEFKVIKVDKTDSDRKLPDAEFTMRKVRPESPFDYLEDASKAVVETTNADGEVEFTEIPAGYYEVKETKLPDGYINTGEEAFYIHVSNGTVNMVVKSSTGFENAQSADDGKFTFDEATETVWASVTVTNIPGAALPNTGGPGTRMFYLLGILFTGLAGAGLILKRRRKE